jgi:hypothetical protein
MGCGAIPESFLVLGAQSPWSRFGPGKHKLGRLAF